MVNIRSLELNVRSMLVEAFSGNTTLGILIWELKPQPLASVPSNVRQKKGFRGRGVWLTVFIDDSYSKHMHDTDKTWMETRMGGTCTKDMHKIGEGWRELGINFRPEDSLYPPEFSSDSANSRSCCYG